MSRPPNQNEPGGADRVRCAYCGANNYASSTACWQCGRALRSLSAASPTPPPVAPAFAQSGSAAQHNVPAYLAPSRPFDSKLAPKAAAALGLLFPWAAAPIGLAFIMLEDPRKNQLGWIAIGWSIVGTILNVVGLIIPLLSIIPLIKSLLSHGGTGLPGSGSGIPSLGGGLGMWESARILLMF